VHPHTRTHSHARTRSHAPSHRVPWGRPGGHGGRAGLPVRTPAAQGSTLWHAPPRCPVAQVRVLLGCACECMRVRACMLCALGFKWGAAVLKLLMLFGLCAHMYMLSNVRGHPHPYLLPYPQQAGRPPGPYLLPSPQQAGCQRSNVAGAAAGIKEGAAPTPHAQLVQRSHLWGAWLFGLVTHLKANADGACSAPGRCSCSGGSTSREAVCMNVSFEYSCCGHQAAARC